MNQTSTCNDTLAAIRIQLEHWDGRSPLPAVTGELLGIAQSARDASRPDVARFAEQFAALIELAVQIAGTETDARWVAELREMFAPFLSALQAALQDEPDSDNQMAELANVAEQRWGEWLGVVDSLLPTARCDADWDSLPEAPLAEDPAAQDHSTRDPADPRQIDLILGSLAQPGAVPHRPDASTDHPDRSVAAQSAPSPPQIQLSPALDDPEIREAYLDDAQQGLSSIESCLIAFEAAPDNRGPLHQVCRELHTLKGASASVGLEQLASFLHRVEDELQAACDQSTTVDLQPIFQAVDAVRAQVGCCLPAAQEVAQPTVPAAGHTPTSNTPSVLERFVDASASHDSVRVKAAQLDRLMDMMAELVMLRNRRESRVEQLKAVHGELVRCVSRLRAYEENYATAAIHNLVSHTGHDAARPSPRQRVSSLTEIANDVLEIGGSLRELYEPVSEENLTISRFIRQFRQELIQLRRVPIASLFQRLQRAVRDAARVEEKQVKLQLVGEQVGIDSALQQQLYEPLLHVVRNAVSHGIEDSDRRSRAGKPATGIVWLEAHGSANMLVVSIRDDGRGLDYDALRRRGLEMGLISAEQRLSRGELAGLIFHPGFSTRTTTSEISGRGVGMDVVASTLERLHGWIEVDSEPGQGTTIRLLVPLQSVIEHVMVFRSGRQHFALPTQFVRFAGSPQSVDTSEFPLTRLSRLFPDLDHIETDTPQLLVLAHSDPAQEALDGHPDPGSAPHEERRLGILIDEIIGPEEVVVRPLPRLLAQQPFLSGVTLSGSGDIMLIFDSQQLLRRGLSADFAGPPSAAALHTDHVQQPRAVGRVLVVDDSRSSRRTLIRCLEQHGFEIDEACDGLDAMRRLKEAVYDLIFTDLEMPQVNGLELVRDIRANKRMAAIPVIMVSSRGEEDFRQQARDVGVTDYLTKPVSEAVVTQALQRVLAGTRSN